MNFNEKFNFLFYKKKADQYFQKFTNKLIRQKELHLTKIYDFFLTKTFVIVNKFKLRIFIIVK